MSAKRLSYMIKQIEISDELDTFMISFVKLLNKDGILYGEKEERNPMIIKALEKGLLEYTPYLQFVKLTCLGRFLYL